MKRIKIFWLRKLRFTKLFPFFIWNKWMSENTFLWKLDKINYEKKGSSYRVKLVFCVIQSLVFCKEYPGEKVHSQILGCQYCWVINKWNKPILTSKVILVGYLVETGGFLPIWWKQPMYKQYIFKVASYQINQIAWV